MAEKQNGFGQAATYQAVIIALVAGCIFTAVMMSLAYRRRRRRIFLGHVARARAGREDLRWVELDDGTLVHIRGRRKRRKELGDVPVMWDFELGEDEVDVGGVIGTEWNPIHAAIDQTSAPTPGPCPCSQKTQSSSIDRDHNVNMAVLIAMPTPHTVITDNRHSMSAESTTSSFSLKKPLHLDNYPVSHTLDPDLDDLPVMEVGTVDVPLHVRKEDDELWKEIMSEVNNKKCCGKPGCKCGTRRTGRAGDETPDSLDVRVDRTDGFRL